MRVGSLAYVRKVRSPLLAGAGSPPTFSAVTPPAGLGYTPPFNVLKQDNAAVYKTDFDMAAVRPTPTHTVYCGAGGVNTNNGTSWALRVRSIRQAIVRANALGSSASIVRILVQAGQYRWSNQDGSAIPDDWAGLAPTRNIVIEPCDASGNLLTSGDRRIISIHDQPIAGSWTLVSGAVYKKPYTTELPSESVWDEANLNSKGNPQGLRYAPGSYANEEAIVVGVAAMAALYGQGATFLDTTNKIVYVQTINGRAPDASIVVGRGRFADNNARNFYVTGGYQSTQTAWVTWLHAWGGYALYGSMDLKNTGANINLYMADCATLYSSGNGVGLDGQYTATLLRHCADDAYQDGYNYDQGSGFNPAAASFTASIALDGTMTVTALSSGFLAYNVNFTGVGVPGGARILYGISGYGGNTGTYMTNVQQVVASTAMTLSGAAVSRVHEIDCVADWAGNSGVGDVSANASSAHVAVKIVRVNTKANRALNRIFHDIQAVKSWLLGCAATNCRQTGTQAGGFASGFLPNTGETAEMWLDGCVSSGNSYDIEAYKGGKAYYRNMTPTPPTVDTATGGTVTTY